MSTATKLIELTTSVNGGIIFIQKNKIIAIEKAPRKQGVLNGTLLHIESISNPILVREDCKTIKQEVWK